MKDELEEAAEEDGQANDDVEGELRPSEQKGIKPHQPRGVDTKRQKTKRRILKNGENKTTELQNGDMTKRRILQNLLLTGEPIAYAASVVADI